MLTQLSTVKERLGLAELETAFDPLLTRAIQAVSAWFDHRCNRSFAREVDAVHEFPADETELRPPCYPIESVSRFELKSDEINGWVVQPDTRFLLRRRCVISLPTRLSTYLDQARVIYTGGYVLPGHTPGPGQFPLPADLEHAAIEQVAYWFQNRDKIGLVRIWEYHATYRQFAEFELLPSVQAVLRKYERWRA
jgi:hypothetical protein